jgi:hypothetical protein
MSSTGFVFKHLRDDREKEIYLEAFWGGVAASYSIKAEMLKLEREWRNGQNKAKATVQPTTTEVQ